MAGRVSSHKLHGQNIQVVALFEVRKFFINVIANVASFNAGAVKVSSSASHSVSKKEISGVVGQLGFGVLFHTLSSYRHLAYNKSFNRDWPTACFLKLVCYLRVVHCFNSVLASPLTLTLAF